MQWLSWFNDFNNVSIASVKGSDYRIHSWDMSKDNAISIMKNSNLNGWKVECYNFFALYKKWLIKTTYYWKKRETILNWYKEYYEIDKERLRVQARNKYRELSREEKVIKREYGREYVLRFHYYTIILIWDHQ